MPFGLCNATATFQRLMAQALTRITKKYGNLVMCYVDDVVIATPTLADHIDRLDEVYNCTNKELRLKKESMGTLLKPSEYCGPIRKKSYRYVSGIVGMAYNLFINEDIPHCYFDYEQAVLLRFWSSRISSIRSIASRNLITEWSLDCVSRTSYRERA